MKANLIEMEGFLRGKCLPGDMLVNETNAQYLVRKFAEAEAKCAALSAENAGLKDFLHSRVDESICDKHIKTPATESFLAEVRAQGVEMAAKSDQFSMWVQQGLRSFAIGVRQGDEK